jgi:glycosyltransferase involved in cell wall biosynthesis
MVRKAGFVYARTVKRHSFYAGNSLFEACTTINAYDHVQDLWKIAVFAKFNPIKIIRYLRWDELAKAMFDRVSETGGEFHLWGHSWEINDHHDWEKLDNVLKYIANKKNVQYVTNSEIAVLNRKKILIVAPYFLPYIGGVQIYVDNIAKRLQNNFGWEVCIATAGNRGSSMSEENHKGIKVYRLPYWFKISNTPVNFLWPFMLRRIIDNENISIINAHAPVPFMSEASLAAAGKIPFVLTYHAGSLHKNILLWDVLIWLYEHGPLIWLLNRADHIICSSDFVRLDFLSAFARKSATITPAVDTNFFKPSEARTGRLTILFVGGLTRSEKHKGLKILIDAFNILLKIIPDLRLVVVGEGDMRSEYEAHARRFNLQEKIYFRGRLVGQDLLSAYHESNVLVLPSLGPAESFGIVLIEAMACGKPVVGTNVGGIPGVIDHEKNGLLVSPNDSLELALAIKRIFENNLFAKQLGQAGIEKVRTYYNWDMQAAKYNDILKNSLDKNPTIVQVVGYYPPHIGGMERVAKNASEYLAQKGHKVFVLTSDKDADKENFQTMNNLTIHAMKSFEFAHTPFTPSLAWHLFKIPRHSLIHLHLSQAYYPEFVWLISKIRGIPYVVHFHLDVEPSGKLGPLFVVYKSLVWGPVLRSAAKIIVCSPEQAVLIQNKYRVKADRIAVIANAVSDDFFYSRTALPMADKLKLLYVGRLSSQKKVDRLIYAMSLLKSPARLTIVGDGEDREKLELLTEKLGLNNISFEGAKNDKEMQKYYQSSDIFLISSDNEGGTPLAVLEAMAASLPVLGSNVAGIRELLQGVGNLIDKPFAEGFADAINFLWQNPAKLRELSVASFNKAKQYTWPRFIIEVEEVYKEIL